MQNLFQLCRFFLTSRLPDRSLHFVLETSFSFSNQRPSSYDQYIQAAAWILSLIFFYQGDQRHLSENKNVFSFHTKRIRAPGDLLKPWESPDHGSFVVRQHIPGDENLYASLIYIPRICCSCCCTRLLLPDASDINRYRINPGFIVDGFGLCFHEALF